jgi:hypothetical protein
MLDWTTSFLSDALIIKPEIAVCQTLSQAVRQVERGGEETTMCGVRGKKEPHSICEAPNEDREATPKVLLKLTLYLSLVQFARQR